MNNLRKILRITTLFFSSLAIASLIVFAVLDKFPLIAAKLKLQFLQYFAIKSTYVADPKLVFRYRYNEYSYKGRVKSDLYSSEYDSINYYRHYQASYNNYGFRVNSINDKPEIFVIGDSFIEIGETDFNTITSYVESITSIPTWNFGRAWYGPYQYLELLKKYFYFKPKIAIFAFFSGNDTKDIKQYNRWLKTGKYYYYSDYEKNSFFQNYILALKDTWVYAKKFSIISWIKSNSTNYVHKDLGLVKAGNKNLKMAFGYYNENLNAKDLIKTKEWKDLHNILSKFNQLCIENKIIPIVLYIPSKIQVYGAMYQDESGNKFKNKIQEQLRYNYNSRDALYILSRNLEVDFIDLLPKFIENAKDDNLLYYQYDSHWNKHGRLLAANIISEYICSQALIACKNNIAD